MLSFSDCHNIIENQLKGLEIGQKGPSELYTPVAYVLALGGKRIRPVLALMGCNLFAEDVTPAIKPALAIEMFHNFTLVHDDMMDNAPLRRNKPTVHAKWDHNVAILSGDAMQIMAYQLMCEGNPGLNQVLLETFNTVAIQVCEGQQYDMNFAARSQVTIPEYLRMIELKTSVLLAASLKMGALCGGAPMDDAQQLYEFGRNLGLAFQIQDDYLDVYANRDLFGKTVGGDIAENKKTFLLINALEQAKGEHAKTLQRAIGNQVTDTSEKVAMVRQVYDQLGIPQLTCNKIAEFSEKAFECLALVKIPGPRKDNLLQLARELMAREK